MREKFTGEEIKKRSLFQLRLWEKVCLLNGMHFPFAKGSETPPGEGAVFYGGARGRFPFFRPRRLIRRGYGAQIYDFSAPSRADALPQSAPPRPLQINRPRQTFVCRGYGLAEPFGLSSALVEPFGSPLPPLPPPAVLGQRSLRYWISKFAVPGTAG